VRSEIGLAEQMALGMDTDKFAALVMKQINNGEFFVVSHAYNIVHINARHKEFGEAYARYAPRCDGDEECDVRTLLSRMAAANG